MTGPRASTGEHCAVPLPRHSRLGNPGASKPRLSSPARWECGCGSARPTSWAQKGTERLFERLLRVDVPDLAGW